MTDRPPVNPAFDPLPTLRYLRDHGPATQADLQSRFGGGVAGAWLPFRQMEVEGLIRDVFINGAGMPVLAREPDAMPAYDLAKNGRRLLSWQEWPAYSGYTRNGLTVAVKWSGSLVIQFESDETAAKWADVARAAGGIVPLENLIIEAIGMTRQDPAETADLTDGALITDGFAVWWDESYAIRSFATRLMESGRAVIPLGRWVDLEEPQAMTAVMGKKPKDAPDKPARPPAEIGRPK